MTGKARHPESGIASDASGFPPAAPIFRARFRKEFEGTASMTAMTATTLGTVLLVVSVLLLVWGFPNLPRR
jgi:hypothetical protein